AAARDREDGPDAAGARDVAADRLDGDAGRARQALGGIAAEAAPRKLSADEQLVGNELGARIACGVFEPRLDDEPAGRAHASRHRVEHELQADARRVAAGVLVDDEPSDGLADRADDGDSDRPGLRAAGERGSQVGGGNTVTRDHHHMAYSISIHAYKSALRSEKCTNLSRRVRANAALTPAPCQTPGHARGATVSGQTPGRPVAWRRRLSAFRAAG